MNKSEAKLTDALASFTVHAPSCPRRKREGAGQFLVDDVVFGTECTCGLDSLKLRLLPRIAKARAK